MGARSSVPKNRNILERNRFHSRDLDSVSRYHSQRNSSLKILLGKANPRGCSQFWAWSDTKSWRLVWTFIDFFMRQNRLLPRPCSNSVYLPCVRRYRQNNFAWFATISTIDLLWSRSCEIPLAKHFHQNRWPILILWKKTYLKLEKSVGHSLSFLCGSKSTIHPVFGSTLHEP